MEKISEWTKKKDHDAKISGRALYVDDHVLDGMLYGKLLHSAKAKARIADIILPELPEGYLVVDKNDVAGVNRVHIVLDDSPIYAEETVEYVGEPILMVVGPDCKEVARILHEIVVVYEEQVPLLDILTSNTVFFNYNYAKGDIDKALAEAEQVFIETFQTGYQEQAYLETQGIIAYPHDRRMTVRGSMQCPYYVHGAVAKALGYEEKDVQVIQDVTGGGFGGKEAFPSILACQTAVAAQKANKPVKVIFDRREDMEFTSKRHPSICTYKVAIKNGEITGMDIEVLFNSGAYTTLSPVVLQRGLICANGVYRIDNLRVTGRAVKTNTVPCGAYRGFGAPQTFFAVEMMMGHIAKELGMDSLELKEKYIAKQGDATSTSGKYHFHVPLPEMIQRLDELCDYRAKRKLYQNQTGRYRKGIGMSMFFHGCGFTGSGERDIIKAIVKIRKNANDTVELLTSNTDIGQGLKTTFCKIVADTLGIAYDHVHIDNPDTDRVPDSGPTVASRSLMTVGGLLQRAAEKLKKEWQPGVEQVIEEHFAEPDFVIPFNLENFKGDAYPTYSWSVNAIELEVDTLTATSKILGAWGIYDVGVPIDLNIIQGQMQGGFLQGIGYASMEQMDYNDKGIIRNTSYSDYIIPTAVDVPNLVTEIMNNPYTHGPYGAKGAGELPLVGVAPAYAEAMENALGANINKVPFTPEDTMRILQEAKNDDRIYS
ncbi:xanthine dehydrogenase family protein molybdopterin-binding subunit [Sporomusa malonica]|uniref:CO or xanthine dehydrogenase, Mo-binding subunit n=1 Tax=Sporomusa malonica TaxID=112901 RepID=A0A1W2A7M2_9FIRM|nr:xanthine dehydrogenase family protein molybdopterin-binding subunit [Sporomusa malonica]SMC56411.1 CO or xanthine dehydrogenase, Mo-binding subunit [Sporomusa malonica]